MRVMTLEDFINYHKEIKSDSIFINQLEEMQKNNIENSDFMNSIRDFLKEMVDRCRE